MGGVKHLIIQDWVNHLPLDYEGMTGFLQLGKGVMLKNGGITSKNARKYRELLLSRITN